MRPVRRPRPPRRPRTELADRRPQGFAERLVALLDHGLAEAPPGRAIMREIALLHQGACSLTHALARIAAAGRAMTLRVHVPTGAQIRSRSEARASRASRQSIYRRSTREIFPLTLPGSAPSMIVAARCR